MSGSKPAFFEFSTREAQIAAAREMNMFSNIFMSVTLDPRWGQDTLRAQ